MKEHESAPGYDEYTNSYHCSEPQAPRGTQYFRPRELRNKEKTVMTDTEYLLQIKRRLREKKKYYSMTYNELSDLTGLPAHQISYVLSECYTNAPSIITLKLVCDAVGISMSELFNTPELDKPLLTR